MSEQKVVIELAKAPAPYSRHGWGIIGPYGNIWDGNIFETAEAAIERVRAFWPNRDDLKGYQIVRCVKTVEAVPDVPQIIKYTVNPVNAPTTKDAFNDK